MAIIKQASQLPKWFNLNNYKLHGSFSSYECLKILVFRKALLRGLGSINTKIEIKDLAHYDNWKEIHKFSPEQKLNLSATIGTQDSLKNIFEFLIKNPLKTHDHYDLLANPTVSNYWVMTAMQALTEYDDHVEHPSPVRDITVDDIGMKYYELPEVLQSVLFNKYENLDIYNESHRCKHPIYQKVISNAPENLTSFSMPRPKGFTKEQYNTYLRLEKLCSLKLSDIESYSDISTKKLLLEVDLGCSDNLLVEQFQIWLKSQRELSKPSIAQKNNALLTLQKIKNYQIFAFLDLYIWSLFSGNKIQNNAYIEALYPYGAFNEGHVLKTLIPFLNKLFDPKSSDISNLMIINNN